MATTDEYAAWIVKNADKKGTPDFETVAKAYQEAKGGQKVMLAQEKEPSAIDELGRQIGLTARHGIEGVAALPGMVANIPAAAYNKVADVVAGKDNGYRFPDQNKVGGAIADKLGLPSPQNAGERIVGDATRAIVPSGAGNLLKNASNQVASKIGEAIQRGPGLQVLSSAAGGAAGGVARENDVGPGGQILATLAAGAAPSSALATGEAALRGLIRGKNAAQFTNNAEIFKEAGAQPSVGQATGSRTMQVIESGLSKSPGSAGVMASAAENQAAGMGAKVGEISDSLSTKANPTVAGRAITKGITGENGFIESFKKKQTDLYDKIDEHMPENARVDVSKTKAALADLNADIPGAPNLSELFKNARIKGIEKAMKSDTESPEVLSTRSDIKGILSGMSKESQDNILPLLAGEFGNELPYEAIKKLRTLVGQELTNPSLIADVPRSKWKALYSALSEDLGGAAKQAGPDAEKAWGRANSYTKAGMDRIDMLNSVLDGKTPEKIFQAATSGTREGATTVNSVMRSLKPEQRKILSATVVKRLGIANPGNQDDLGETFSSQTFLTNWNKISQEAKRILFGFDKSVMDNLSQVAKAADMIKTGSKVFANPSGTQQAMSNQAVGVGLATATALGHPATAALILGGIGSANLSAKALTNPKVVRWLAQTTKLSPSAVPAQLNLLSKISANEKDPQTKAEIDQYISGIQTQLTQSDKEPQVSVPQE